MDLVILVELAITFIISGVTVYFACSMIRYIIYKKEFYHTVTQIESMTPEIVKQFEEMSINLVKRFNQEMWDSVAKMEKADD